MSTNSDDLSTNTDLTVQRKEGTYRKPIKASVGVIENGLFDILFKPSYGHSFYVSLLNAFSSLFEWKNLPEDNGLTSTNLELLINQSGRVKFIKVGSKFIIVRFAPQKWNHYGDVIESIIVEPWLPKLSGKRTEIFRNVEIRNNSLGHSLIRMIYPFIINIDDTFNNLEINARILAGKFLVKGTNPLDKDNSAETDSYNQWLTDGRPIKIVPSKLLESMGDNGFMNMAGVDATESFLKEIKFCLSSILNVLGIPNNSNDDKKERLVVDEINIQNILQSSIIDNMLNYRKKAVEDINKEFNLNLSVDLKEEFKLLVEATNHVNEEQGEEDA